MRGTGWLGSSWHLDLITKQSFQGMFCDPDYWSFTISTMAFCSNLTGLVVDTPVYRFGVV